MHPQVLLVLLLWLFRMWLMSDRAIPRSYANMEGFGIHTFRFINDQGVSRFVKFHWKPKLGVHSLVWDEVQKLAGKNSDYNRQQMWESIEAGNFLEYELGLQVLEEGDDLKYGFDILDATKLIPEELVPVQIVGRMVLNRWTFFQQFFFSKRKNVFGVGVGKVWGFCVVFLQKSWQLLCGNGTSRLLGVEYRAGHRLFQWSVDARPSLFLPGHSAAASGWPELPRTVSHAKRHIMPLYDKNGLNSLTNDSQMNQGKEVTENN